MVENSQLIPNLSERVPLFSWSAAAAAALVPPTELSHWLYGRIVPVLTGVYGVDGANIGVKVSTTPIVPPAQK